MAEADGHPRSSRRFRAWGAAQEKELSLWGRFVAWLSGLFAGKSRADDSVVSTETTDEIAAYSAVPSGGVRRSFDELLDTQWPRNSFREELRSRRQSDERPTYETFEENRASGAFDAIDDVLPETPESDPVWDEPRVAEPAAPPPSLASDDFDEVWTPPVPIASARLEPLPPPKQGFFARLFGRKNNNFEALRNTIAARTSGENSLDPSQRISGESSLDPSQRISGESSISAATVAPADADFADDIAASVAPAEDDFASESRVTMERPRNSAALDHSAEDAATLAALLGSTAPASVPASVEDVQEVDAEIEVEIDLDPSPSAVEEVAAADTVVFEQAPPIVSPIETVNELPPAPAIAATDPVEEVRDVPTSLEPSVPEMPVVSLDAEPKKLGFFSSLLKRVSRSQFTVRKEDLPPELPSAPPAFEAAEADVPVVEPLGAAAPAFDPLFDAPTPAVEPPVEERPVELEALWSQPPEAPAPPPTPPAPIAAAEMATVEFSPPPMPVRPAATPPAPAADDLESTQPFMAFRDARDDFDETQQIPSSSRPTDQVDLSTIEQEKTDEFEVVPNPAMASVAEGATMEAPGFFGRLFGKKGETLEREAAIEAAAAAPVAAHTVVDAPDDKLPFVLAKFRIFYNEIIRDKHQKSDVIAGFATAIVSAPAADMSDPEFAAALLSKRLSEMLELQTAEANWTGGDAAKYYPEAQYAMVALADETFLTFDWPGRSAWHKHMLEPRMFGTRGADIEFFKRIDKLLKDNPEPEKGARDLARLYLMVIASGYRGKFRVPGVKRPLAEYRRRLYEFSHRADPLELYGRDRRVFPQAVTNVLASKALGRFTSAQKWTAAVLILVLLYIGASHFAWSRLSADLDDVVSRIQTAISQQGGTR